VLPNSTTSAASPASRKRGAGQRCRRSGSIGSVMVAMGLNGFSAIPACSNRSRTRLAVADACRNRHGADRTERCWKMFAARVITAPASTHREHARGGFLRAFDHGPTLAARNQLPGLGVAAIGIDLLIDFKPAASPARPIPSTPWPAMRDLGRPPAPPAPRVRNATFSHPMYRAHHGLHIGDAMARVRGERGGGADLDRRQAFRSPR